MKRILGILLMLLTTLAFGQNSFNYGEKATYNAYWNGIKVGTVVLEVLPKKANSDDYTFRMKMATNSFAEKFYNSQQTITSIMDKNISHSKSYHEKGKEKKKEKERKIDFDWKNKKTKYYRNGKFSKELTLKEGTLDPLSIFYFFRNQDIKVGKVVECNVTDGKKLINGSVRVKKEETIKVGKLGKMKTYLLEPTLNGLGGVFSGSDDAKMEIWLSQGESKLPVRIKSKVKVGSFTAELVSVTGGKL